MRLLALKGPFDQGLALYHSNPAPSPEDMRWAALCLLNLGRYLEAKDVLHRAIALGCSAARVELGSCFRALGQLDLAEQTLAQISQPLDPFDQSLLEREFGMVYMAQGLLPRAKDAFERAWGQSFAPGVEVLQAGIAHALGYAHYQLGQDRAALEMFEKAMLSASPTRQQQIRELRSLSLLYLGRYPEAEAELKQVILGFGGQASNSQMAMFYYACGLLERARGSLVQAYHEFVRSIEQARAIGEAETVCYGELQAAAVQIVLGQEVQARVHLAHARSGVPSKRLGALLKLREGMFAARFANESSDEASSGTVVLALLSEALSTFATLELVREQAWVKLHVVDLWLSLGKMLEAEQILAQVTDLRHQVGGGGFLALELRGLPRVLEYLESLTSRQYSHILLEDWRGLSPNSLRHLRLQTLGKEQFWLDGQELSFDLSRCMELACYFLSHPTFTLKEALLDLFPDEDPSRARNYFHQVRYELERVIPGFNVKFGAGHYTLLSEHLRITWDYDTVLRGLRSNDAHINSVAITAYGGPFLTNFESDWVQNQRDDLAKMVARAGVRVLQTKFQEGDYLNCLRLASELLEVEPYNPEINDMLVKTSAKLEGDLTARRILVRLCQRFLRDLGEVPEYLIQLRDHIVNLN